MQRGWVGTPEGADEVSGADEVEVEEVYAWSAWAAARVRPEARATERVAEGIEIRVCGEGR